MSYFTIKLSKSDNQRAITIAQTDEVDISGITTAVANVYTDDLNTAFYTYTLSPSEVSALAAGTVTLTSTNLFGEAEPDDDFYTVKLTCSGSLTSYSAGVGITLEACGKVYNKQGFVDVYAHDFKIDRVLHTAHMLLAEMNGIENQEPTLQKRVDFTTRHDTLKTILNY